MTGSTEIRTARLLLRPYSLSDAEDVYEYASDPEWGRFLPLPSPYKLTHAESHVAEMFLSPWDENPTFAICLQEKVVGDVRIRVDAKKKTAELGYSIAKKLWGKGLMVEAVVAAVNWLFENSDTVKVSARADLENRQSWRVMEKLGMKREGVFRSDMPSAIHPERRSDTVCYGVLRVEWAHFPRR